MKYINTAVLLFFLLGKMIAQGNTVPHSVYYPDASTAFPYIEPSQVGIDSSKLSIIREELLRWLTAGDIVNGELLILKGERTVLHETFGWRIKDQNVAVEPNSIWWIRSHTKPITATVVLLLEKEGKLSLEDKVSKYYPNFAGYPQTTIEDLLAHRAGITMQNDDWNIELYDSLEEYAEKVASHSVKGQYGEYGYDNMGYIILGGIIEQVLEESIEEYITSNILEKLDMNDTYTKRIPDKDFISRYTTEYQLHPFSQHYFVQRTHKVGPTPYFMAASGIMSTVTDYAKFLTTFKNKGLWQDQRIFPDDIVERMLTLNGFANRNPFDVGFGLGWWVNTDHDNKNKVLNFGHEGGDQALSYVYPQDDLTIIFYGSSGGLNITRSVKNLICESNLVKDHYSKLYTVSADKFKEEFKELSKDNSYPYTGYYIGPQLRENLRIYLEVYMKDDKLKMAMCELGREKRDRFDLFYIGNDRFKDGRIFNGRPDWVSSNIVFKFNREKDKINSIDMMEGEQTVMSFRAIDKDELTLKNKDIKINNLIDNVVHDLFTNESIEAAKSIAIKLHKDRPETILFKEDRLNKLGYNYLQLEEYEKALATFEINVEAYPNSPNTYDSLADAWNQAGNYKKAQKYYKLAYELAVDQNDPRAMAIEKRLQKIINKQKK